MDKLLQEIRSCKECQAHLDLGCRPVLRAHKNARIAIIGQAPGTKVHASGIPWDDQSGKRLRAWMGIADAVFYDEQQIAIIPMGFCYPGKGKSGDLPPRPECAPLWHDKLWQEMPNIELVLLIGQYAQNYYLGSEMKKNLTETVRNYSEYLPKYIVLPHPSPRNGIWLRKNAWFEEGVIPELKTRVKDLLNDSSKPTLPQ